MRVAADALHKRAEDSFEKTVKREASLRCGCSILKKWVPAMHALAAVHLLAPWACPLGFPSKQLEGEVSRLNRAYTEQLEARLKVDADNDAMAEDLKTTSKVGIRPVPSPFASARSPMLSTR